MQMNACFQYFLSNHSTATAITGSSYASTEIQPTVQPMQPATHMSQTAVMQPQRC